MTFPAENSGLRPAFIGIAIVVAGLVAHGASLWVPFQFDDLHQVAGNPAFRNLGYLPQFFSNPWLGSTTGHTFFFRPVLFSTFLFDGLLGSGSPVPYRVTSLVLLFIFVFLCREFVRLWLPRVLPDADQSRVEWTAWAAAGLMVVHPLLNESILLASGRSSLLMATFGVAALTQLIKGFEDGRRLAVVIVFTALALLTKETAVVLALLAVLLSLTASPRPTWVRKVWDAWPVWGPVALYVLFYFAARRVGPLSSPAPMPTPSSALEGVQLLSRPAQGLAALGGLARLALFPWGLSLTHEVPIPTGSLRWFGYLGWPALLGSGVFLMSRRNLGRVAGFGILWFALALMPILLAGLNSPMAEHRVVLAMVGPALFVAFLLSSLRHLQVRSFVTAAALSVLAAASLLQTLPWRSPLELWRHEVALNPNSTRARAFLAGAHSDAGEIDQARDVLAPVLAYAGENVVYLTQAAQIEMAGNDPVQAGRWTSRGLAVDGDYVPLLLLEVERLAITGDLPGAKGYALHAVTLADRCSPCWNALGNVLFMQGDAGSVEAYRRAVERDPNNQEAITNLTSATRRWPG